MTKREIGHGYRCIRFSSGNSAGRNPPDAVSQKVASSLQSCGYESDQQSIRTSLARLRNRYSCRPEVRRVYRTPVNVFRAPNGFLIALTYGRESERVRNVLAADGCQLETRGVRYQLSAPTIMHDPTRRRFPFPVRVILGFVGANDFMQFSASQAPAIAH